jgi:hypothetical protein
MFSLEVVYLIGICHTHTHTQVQRPAHVGGFSDSAQQGGPATSPPLHDRSQRAQHVGPAPPRDAPYGTLHL